jgi:alanyl-tRNA synthetase
LLLITVRGVGISSPKHQLTDAQRAAFKVIVDHARASAALIADGVLPSAVGRGYVLRRIIRRALRYATTLGATRTCHSPDPTDICIFSYLSELTGPVLCELVPALVSSQSVTLPNLSSRAHVIEATLRAEEEAFLSTLKRGERILNEALQKSSGQLPASVVHELYDRFGFPVDLTALIAQERGVSFDQSAVEGMICVPFLMA